MNKKRWIIAIIILTSVILVAAGTLYLLQFAQPQIDVSCNVDFKIDDKNTVVINTKIEFKQPPWIISNREIKSVDLYDVLYDEKDIKLSTGTSFTQDNASELKATYEQRRNIKLEGKDINQVKEAVGNIQIEMKWHHKFRGQQKEIFYLQDYME